MVSNYDQCNYRTIVKKYMKYLVCVFSAKYILSLAQIVALTYISHLIIQYNKINP